MKKIICCAFLLFTLVSAFSVTVSAGSSRINDTADLLTDAEEQKLIEYTDEIYNKYGVDVVIVLEDTYRPDPRFYAENYYDTRDYSKDGIIFYLSVYDRDWYMATSGSCVRTLSDRRLDYIFEQIRADLSWDDFYSACCSFTVLCDEYLESGPAFRDTFAGGYILRLLVVLPIAFVIALIIVSSEKKKMNTAVLQKDANSYIINGSMNITESKDVFVTSTVTCVPISQNRGGGGGGGHRGGGGHGGRGGKF